MYWIQRNSLFAFIICVLTVFETKLIANHHHHNHLTKKWFRSETLDGNGLYELNWKIVDKDIIFRATVNTRGYIGLGFSYKSHRIGDADIILAWVDDRTGQATVLVSFYLIFLFFIILDLILN